MKAPSAMNYPEEYSPNATYRSSMNVDPVQIHLPATSKVRNDTA